MYYDGTNWLRIITGTTGKMLTINASGLPEWQTASGSGWSLTGNAGTTSGTNFIGTTDSQDLVFKIGGTQSGLLDLHIGNTSWGYGALNPATTGTDNIAIGQAALSYNTIGAGNTAIGSNTLMSNTSANLNTAIGYWSLKLTTGRYNTANGAYSLSLNTTGYYNTAVGFNALQTNTTGRSNTAIGYDSDVSGSGFTNATAIGANAYAGASNSMVLGSISGVNGASSETKVGIGTTTPQATLHVIGTTLAAAWSTSSDRRLKNNIVNTHFGITDLMKIQVRDYTYKADAAKTSTTGFIAQELYEIFPNAVTKPAKAEDMWSVDYGKVTPLLVKAIQEQQAEIEALKAKLVSLDNLKAENAAMKTDMEALKKAVYGTAQTK